MSDTTKRRHDDWSSWLGMVGMGQQQRKNNEDHDKEMSMEVVHLKRLAMILRYIGTMHHSTSNNSLDDGSSFVRECRNSKRANLLLSSDFFRRQLSNNNDASLVVMRKNNDNNDGDESDDDEGMITGGDDGGHDSNSSVLFTTSDFRDLLLFDNDNQRTKAAAAATAATATSTSFASSLFSFYKASSLSSSTSRQTNHKSNKNSLTFSYSLPTSSSSTRRRRLSSSNCNNSNDEDYAEGDKTCWLRLTRPSVAATAASAEAHHQPPTIQSQAVHTYLENWKRRFNIKNLNKLLTLENLSKAPKIVLPTTNDSNSNNKAQEEMKEIKSFLRQYKSYLIRQKIKSTIEPMYNNLFEWLQQQDCNSQELVWGFGNAKQIQMQNDFVINGPLLEVLVEVELARDGALIVRPREHTGVSINREVISAIVNTNNSSNSNNNNSSTTTTINNNNDIISNLHRTVSEMDTSQLSPGEPSTYNKILKRIAMELSAFGTFQSLSSTSSSSSKRKAVSGSNDNSDNNNRLLVTDAWCLYYRKKPSTVWARDAKTIEEQLMLLAKKRSASSSSLSSSSSSDSSLMLLQQQNNVPKAAWSLTHGPGVLDSIVANEEKEKQWQKKKKNMCPRKKSGNGLIVSSVSSFLFGNNNDNNNCFSNNLNSSSINNNSLYHRRDDTKPLFPLPTSDSQNRIAELLLTNNYPAVVCEGPPGTGKTHTIANLICAYLCQGKRILITSKGTPALSVLRQRLPKCVQELCVDVSASETTGMRQLQQTVERLADKVSYLNTNIQIEKCNLIQHNIDELEQELKEIDLKLKQHNERKQRVLQSPNGQRLAQLALSLIESVPWLMKATSSWKATEVKSLHQRIKSIYLESDNPTNSVSDYASPPSDSLISLVAAEAGSTLSYLKNSAVQKIASLPLVGKEMIRRREELQKEVSALKVDNNAPHSKVEWQLALKSLNHDKAIFVFHQDVMESLAKREKWNLDDIYDNINGKRRIKKTFVEYIGQVLTLKEISEKVNVSKEIELSTECKMLDNRRTMITQRVQQLAEELVEAKVVSELSRMFSSEAQSALIRFAQIAGKNKFSKSSQPSKMTQRQKRHRQEYLDAFEKCVRFIPCWILTSSQVSDYLPPELGLFDLVVIDEASQSDATVLPSMLRGKQWLIVGDGKQVSPSESFLSETHVDSLRAALPADCPLEECLLPGHSFFDLCAQAYPRGRTVLCEHFRCSPSIIEYSNDNYYGGKLVPMRLPTSAERMTPSIVDVRVDGVKVGKVNEKECDKIVSMVQGLVMMSSTARTRSIGVISLVGDEQSKLIRGRLLDAIGPQKYKEHNILCGDPPHFQGSERDVIFLSLCCSPGRVPTQNQLMYAQRANVALSRARDRMVLVRSIDLNHVPNAEDVKIPILDFFSVQGENDETSDGARMESASRNFGRESVLSSLRVQAEKLLQSLLVDRNYTVRPMEIIPSGICVENEDSRLSISIVSAGESTNEWKSMMSQQKSIERVGWKCMRIEALSLLTNHNSVMQSIESFLSLAGVKPSSFGEGASNAAYSEVVGSVDAETGGGEGLTDNEAIEESQEDPIIVEISSDDDEATVAAKSNSNVCHSDAKDYTKDKEESDDMLDPRQFGDVVGDLGFLRGIEPESEKTETSFDTGDDDGKEEVVELSLTGSDQSHHDVQRLPNKRERPNLRDDEMSYLGDQSEGYDDTSSTDNPSKKKRRSYRRLDKYSRDGRWYPIKKEDECDLDEQGKGPGNWYDTDSDLGRETEEQSI